MRIEVVDPQQALAGPAPGTGERGDLAAPIPEPFAGAMSGMARRG